MHEQEKHDSTENRSPSRRLVSSLPSLLVFVAMVYFSVVFFRDGLSLSRVPLWMRLPFFLYCVLTVFVGLLAGRPLFPTKRQKDDAANTGDAVKPATGNDESSPSRTTSASFIVSALQVTYSVLMFTCCAGIFTLLFRSPSLFGAVGSAIFGVIASILLIASLKWPVKAIRRKLKSNRG
jgi:hypothetical protein